MARQVHSRLAYVEDQRRQSYYDMLSEMDPYKGSPKEFIHLLVRAAMRDEEVSKALHRMNDERIQNPASWQPLNPPWNQQHPQSTLHGHFQLQPIPTVPVGYGPQQPPMPQPVLCYAYPLSYPGLGHRPLPEPLYGQPAPNTYPQLYSTPPSRFKVPPYPTTSHPVGVPSSQVQHPPATPQYDPIPNSATNSPGNVNKSNSTSPNTSTSHTDITMADHAVDTEGGAVANDSANVNEYVVGLEDEDEDEDPEYVEQIGNFSWVVNEAQTYLGWTGKWDKEPATRQDILGKSAATKLQKLLKMMNAMADIYVTFRNRIHILSVMRQVILVTLDTDSRIGDKCREMALEYDSLFVEAVGKLTASQKRKIKVLRGGRWMIGLLGLIDYANKLSIFPRLREVPALIDS
ncbi:uncharacterized protein GGS25DRAFT_373264 [Hypoxylon fragiforme]|uniref:uncharacterized protein n=1 Tax=Hypoxylon fragiforme TaxID=63214 RepID=UPI0020C62BD3|nr:uncharacterized protein GGS25DRAFT_373264 [Hypoxylon fragiforme]KAI2606091.1 hypothetical protein GGS25DRAFT_373264 [Hypoxylon fragiforme]